MKETLILSYERSFVNIKHMNLMKFTNKHKMKAYQNESVPARQWGPFQGFTSTSKEKADVEDQRNSILFIINYKVQLQVLHSKRF